MTVPIFTSADGLSIHRQVTTLDYSQGIDHLVDELARERGVFFSSGIEYPGRYTRWQIGVVRPPLELIGRGRRLEVRALNPRGRVLLPMVTPVLSAAPEVSVAEADTDRLVLEVASSTEVFPEEQRSLQPTVLTPVRSLLEAFRGFDDPLLGLYGAFGYDLIFQFDPVPLRHPRGESDKTLHLFLPDVIYALDRQKESLFRYDYRFCRDGADTASAASVSLEPLQPTEEGGGGAGPIQVNYSDEAFAELVEAARARMAAGDVYEVVLHRRFSAEGRFSAPRLFREFRQVNPSPYEFLCQLGDEQLIGTSPEMFIRVTGSRIESSPISGTVRSGGNAMEDAERIKALVDSAKDEVELTMCTDVDRNDKARICEPGSIRLLNRRAIERYAGLFHTVDHVEGRLRQGLTGLDAFQSHMWAVTLTGAPKRMAVELIEAMESAPRGWYGGAVGVLHLNGDVTTGITIRTIFLRDGRAEYPAGATLVYDSDGLDEAEETRTKATGFFHLMGQGPARGPEPAVAPAVGAGPGQGRRVVLIDNEDSFVHILADYVRQTGAEVVTYRSQVPLSKVLAPMPDLVMHSPGPGWPARFAIPERVRWLADRGVAQFGVCLGLQGIVEAYGGTLGVLTAPRQGKRWRIHHGATGLFEGLPLPSDVGAYHALYADPEALPDELEALATTLPTEGVPERIVMAVGHRSLPIWAVQFHPESILSMGQDMGRRLIHNLMGGLARR